jgi:hypothetical protein
MFRRSSSAVATRRKGHHPPRSGRAVQHRRWGRGRVSHGMPKEKKRADRRGRPARSGDELTTTASCQGEKATTCQLVAPTRRRASRVGAKKLVDRLSRKAKVEDRKSVTSSAWPTPWSLGWSTPLQEQSRVLVPYVPSWFPGCRIFMGE